MVLLKVVPVNSIQSPFAGLSCLEEAVHKRYDQTEERNKTSTITVRHYPVALFYSFESVMETTGEHYASAIERYAILYAISLLEKYNYLEDIAEYHRTLVKTGTLRDLRAKLNNSKGLPFCTQTMEDRTCISMPLWCKEWIQSNRRYFGMNASQLTIYLLIYALSHATIVNDEVRADIHRESEWFIQYLENEKQRLRVL